MQKLLDRFLKNFDIKVAHAPWKNPLDIGGNANHDYVTVGWRISHRPCRCNSLLHGRESDFECGLTEVAGTVKPWRRFALY